MDRKHLLRAAAVLGLVILAIAVWSAASRTIARRSDPGRPGHAAERSMRQPTADDGRGRVLAAYENLPLAFVENRGQTDGRVEHYAQGSRR